MRSIQGDERSGNFVATHNSRVWEEVQSSQFFLSAIFLSLKFPSHSNKHEVPKILMKNVVPIMLKNTFTERGNMMLFPI